MRVVEKEVGQSCELYTHPGQAALTLEPLCSDKGAQPMNVMMPGLERRLRGEVSGDVLFDAFSRGRYATDASHYQMMPLGVVVPRTIEDAKAAIGLVNQEGATVLARGGGTSQCGQTLNHSLVIDCSKHLNKVLELDVENRRCVVEPGI